MHNKLARERTVVRAQRLQQCVPPTYALMLLTFYVSIHERMRALGYEREIDALETSSWCRYEPYSYTKWKMLKVRRVTSVWI
jgi:hypothetical protein